VSPSASIRRCIFRLTMLRFERGTMCRCTRFCCASLPPPYRHYGGALTPKYLQPVSGHTICCKLISRMATPGVRAAQVASSPYERSDMRG
jgi:hypothetical protein